MENIMVFVFYNLYLFINLLSRVTDGKHHVTDVLAGGSLGILFALAAIFATGPIPDKRCTPEIVIMIVKMTIMMTTMNYNLSEEEAAT